jgi:hypothetical protein
MTDHPNPDDPELQHMLEPRRSELPTDEVRSGGSIANSDACRA